MTPGDHDEAGVREPVGRVADRDGEQQQERHVEDDEAAEGLVGEVEGLLDVRRERAERGGVELVEEVEQRDRTSTGRVEHAPASRCRGRRARPRTSVVRRHGVTHRLRHHGSIGGSRCRVAQRLRGRRPCRPGASVVAMSATRLGTTTPRRSAIRAAARRARRRRPGPGRRAEHSRISSAPSPLASSCSRRLIVRRT